MIIRRCAGTPPHSRFFRRHSQSPSLNPACTKSCEPSHLPVSRPEMNASASIKRQILTTRRLTPAGVALSALGPSPCGSHRSGQVVVWEEVAPHMFRGVVNEGAQLWQGCASAGIVEEKSRDIGCVAIEYALQLALVEIVHYDRARQPKEPNAPERRAQT